MHLNRFFESQTGKYMFSIILGIGLASLFRKVFKDKNCIVLKPPPLDEIQNKVYRFQDKCYSYHPEWAKCDKSKKIVSF